MALKLATTTVVRPGLEPTAALGEHGRRAWDLIQYEYEIRDAGGLLLLTQICEAIDRIAELGAVVAREGLMIRGRVHSAAREQTALRAFICRQLARLGIIYEPVKTPGRPTRGY